MIHSPGEIQRTDDLQAFMLKLAIDGIHASILLSNTSFYKFLLFRLKLYFSTLTIFFSKQHVQQTSLYKHL